MDYITTNIALKLEELNIFEGTLPSHVYSITFFVPVSSLLFSVMTAKTKMTYQMKTIAEAILINLVLLISLTKPFCDYSFLLVLSLMVVLGTSFVFTFNQSIRDLCCHIKKIILEEQNLDDFNTKFIGEYRGHLLLATSVCILAVDFAVFPEYFSKTNTYGWSVMDAGVGSFVLIHGLCSSSARKSTIQVNSFQKCMLSSLPLFLLGVIRLVVTTAVGYHKVVPEYGVHWNFFFTLAITKVMCYFLSSCFFFIPPGFLAIIISTFHQFLLSNGLTDFILTDFRRNLLEANKEGICSLPGFVAIYFFGVQLGQLLWNKRNKLLDFFYLFVNLNVCGICGWILMYAVHEYVQPVSRRMANTAYCIWVITLTGLQIALHLIHQIINFILHKEFQKDFSECILWKALNYNGLFYFLLANVLTGLVNLSIRTETCNDGLSLIILVLYLSILNIPVIMLYKRSLQLKFW